jgi:hypothetical protein
MFQFIAEDIFVDYFSAKNEQDTNSVNDRLRDLFILI